MMGPTPQRIQLQNEKHLKSASEINKLSHIAQLYIVLTSL